VSRRDEIKKRMAKGGVPLCELQDPRYGTLSDLAWAVSEIEALRALLLEWSETCSQTCGQSEDVLARTLKALESEA
jgi:hypothetical protein